MKNIKRLFSLPFYRDTLGRLRIFGIVCAVVFGALSAVCSLTYLLAQVGSDFLGAGLLAGTSRLSLSDINGYTATFVLAVVPIMTVCAFSFLMKRSTADFYGALPVSRVSMAVSGMLAVLTVSVFVIAVSSVVAVVALIPCMGKTVEYEALTGLWELFGFIFATALSIAVSALASAICGTVMNGIVTALIIAHAPRAVMGLFNLSLEFLNPTLVSGHIIPFFDEKYNMLTALLWGDSPLISPESFVYTLILTLLAGAFATFVLNKRRSETATHPFAFNSARHAVRIAFATVIVMLGVMIVSINNILLIVGAVIFVLAVGAYFIYELITGRKEGNFIGSLITFPIFVALNGLIVLALVISNNAFANYSPSASEIKAVSIVSEPDEYSYMDYADYVTLRSQSLSACDEASRRTVADALDRIGSEESGDEYVSAVFKIKTSRGTAYRRLTVKSDELYLMMHTLAKKPEYERLWLSVAEGAESPGAYLGGMSISEEGSRRILNAAEREIKALGFEWWYQHYQYSSDIYTYVYYSIDYEGKYYEVALPIYTDMTETVAVCERERRSAAEGAVVSLRNMVLDSISGKGETVWLELTVKGEKSYYMQMEMTEDSSNATGAFSSLMQMLSTDSVGEDEPFASISCYGDGLFSDYVYLELALKPEVDTETLDAFFEKYGGIY